MQTSSRPGHVAVHEQSGVLSVTLENPEAGNEVTSPMFATMLEVLAAQASRPSARVLHLRAKGSIFCTGRERSGKDALSLHAEVTRLIALKKALRNTPLITIAEVQGDAKGFGLGLAILCDFTLVSSSASLAFPEMRKGLPPAAIMAYLGKYALPKQSFPLVLFGDDFTPQQALEAGLITRVCAPQALAADAAALAARITTLDPESARQCKSYFQQAQEGSLEQNFRLATETLVVNSLRLMDAARS
ncbi:MAG TPA: enoyl-CoA hydratase/isomerase family protein [Burkholderiaceae bacterium]|jgi:methylglutaconyl-CoA hydratase